MKRLVIELVLWSTAGIAFLFLLHGSPGSAPPLDTLFDPDEGVFMTIPSPPSRNSNITLEGLSDKVTLVRDKRGVPHIFASSDRDAVMAMGYAVAEDRLFQLDFLSRVASGTLSEVLGPEALEIDRFLRQTGMEIGARRNLARIEQEAGIELEIIDWFVAGVNQYREGLDQNKLPLEFRLLGYQPATYTRINVLRTLQYMTFDLTFDTRDPLFSLLKQRLGTKDFERLYPAHSAAYEPIVPTANADIHIPEVETTAHTRNSSTDALFEPVAALVSQKLSTFSLAEGFIRGKGSNNWAVNGTRSATGAPILAGDMHLRLSLPAIWYETHLITPTMNVYGVTIPGAPLPVEAFNDRLGWTFTNTGADQIDYYALKLDDSGKNYWFDGQWVPLDVHYDTIYVKGQSPVVDTAAYCRFGPVVTGPESAVSFRWVGHEPSRTLLALWKMNHARTLEQFEQGTRLWDSPMQNILYGDVDGNIAIRSTGYLPVRKRGSGAGILDGSTADNDWIGRIPFEELPQSRNPDRGYLFSTNQEPADGTYPHFLKAYWDDSFRSIRISRLLRQPEAVSVEDVKRFQSDVLVVQKELFDPLLKNLPGLTGRTDSLRTILVNWDGEAGVESNATLGFWVFLNELRRITWDEDVFVQPLLSGHALGIPVNHGVIAARLPEPELSLLIHFLEQEPDSRWMDVVHTPETENAEDLLRLALEQSVAILEKQYGWDIDKWRWGNHHKIEFRHITQSKALAPLWRGPFEYPGFEETLSPGSTLVTTHSASWRMVVDFSSTPARGYGVYPGGQQGNPFDELYDAQINTYLNFKLYDLIKPVRLRDLGPDQRTSTLHLQPG